MRESEEILEKSGYDETNVELFWTECYLDYLYFAKHVLGFEISKYHERWYELAEKFPRLSIQAYRGSGKTTWFLGYFLWKSIFREGTTCLLVSHNFEQAKLLLKAVRTMIMDNKMLRDFAPENRSLSWRATEITLNNSAIFYSRTYGEGMRGLRIDFCLCDEGGQYEDKTIFWTVIVPVVQLNRGRIIVIGTPKSMIDLLAELFENDEYYAEKYPVEIDGVPLWHQKYTMSDVDVFGKRSIPSIRREMGELNYQQEYMLVPISSANSVFPMNLVMMALDDAAHFEHEGRKSSNYVVGVDLAITETGDWTVFTVLAYNTDGKRLVYAERFRGGLQEQTKRLQNISRNFQPLSILVDKTGLGEQIFREFAKVIPQVKPFHFTAEEKHNLIMDLRREFENGTISLPNNPKDNDAYQYTQNLIEELASFQVQADLNRRTKIKFSSGKYDDAVISLALANKAINSFSKETFVRLI